MSTLDFFLLDRVIIAFSRFVYAYQYFLSLIRVNGKQNKGFFPKDKRCFLRKKRCDLSQPQRQRKHIVCNFFSFEARDWCMCAFVRVVCCVVKIVQINWESALVKVSEVSEKFSISAEIYDDEATHGYRPLSCRRARIIKSLLFLVFLKTNAENTSKKFLVETCGHIELRTMMIKYNFFFMIPREFPFLPLHMRYILSYKAIIINAVSY